MELLVHDPEFKALAIFDTFESLIWTDRYCNYGDFEIHTPMSSLALTLLQQDNYLWSKESDHVMIIESFQINADTELGTYLTVGGRSLESILERRIIWGQTVLSGNFQEGIQKLLNENAIAPTATERKISNLIFEASTDPNITSLTIDAQFTGDNLYDAIQKLCDEKGVGFSIKLTDDNKFKFKLYLGADRSYDQLTNPYVVFSPNFENLTNSNYLESKKLLKTVTLVGGEGEGADRVYISVEGYTGAGSELSRREIFTNANDVSSIVETGTLTLEEYSAQLAQRGFETLSENISISSFEGQIENTQLFKYSEHFFMGDIVQIANEYGLESKSRVTEVVYSQNSLGIDIYPTFSTI